MSDSELQFLVAALRGYLGELQETGVDGLPFDSSPAKTACPAIVAEEHVEAQPEKPSAGSPASDTVEDIRRELGDCQRCALGATRNNLVFGAGNAGAELVFVGEAPGRDEDLQGEPFVGEAGQLLTKIIQAMGFSRDDVYICNVLKCRPPNNRNPQPVEIEACHPFLLRQLRAIGPKVIVALGTFAAQTLLQTREPISRLRGRFHDYHGIALMPTFHPAYLLRNPAMKREVWDDMKTVMKMLGREAAPVTKSNGDSA